MARVGVLVVHGIGSQRHGETVDKVGSGIAHAMSAELGRDGEVRTLRAEGTEARFYEVHWAHVLEGDAVKHTFIIDAR